jgi:predicted transcriptional regulator
MQTMERPIKGAPPESRGMGVRISAEQRTSLEVIARKQCNSVGGIIRLAISQLLANEESAKSALSHSSHKEAA